eukprot:12915502-Prorocentrum_lima.AAC.1
MTLAGSTSSGNQLRQSGRVGNLQSATMPSMPWRCLKAEAEGIGGYWGIGATNAAAKHLGQAQCMKSAQQARAKCVKT